MGYIKKEELIIGEIYNCANLSGSKYIVKIPNDLYNSININKDVPRLHKRGNFTTETLQWSLATPEEKHWLNTCIEQDTFITFEEAMKTFIPEYVECIKTSTDRFTKNKIYKVEDKGYDKTFVLLDNTNVNIIIPMIGNLWSFKPSTKEAYDAQFVVIESLPQFKIIETIETITKVENNEGNQFFIGDEVIGSKTKIKSKIISFKYNVDKTAILAITDKTPNIGIGINHLEHYIEPKVEETLLEKAKRLYPIGTVVKSASFNDVRTIGTDIFKERNHECSGKIIYADNGGISIYSEQKDKWAEIIK